MGAVKPSFEHFRRRHAGAVAVYTEIMSELFDNAQGGVSIAFDFATVQVCETAFGTCFLSFLCTCKTGFRNIPPCDRFHKVKWSVSHR